jgi:hypothetical protein
MMVAPEGYWQRQTAYLRRSWLVFIVGLGAEAQPGSPLGL